MDVFCYSNEIVALIPARSGSKGIPHKNIREFAGKPLLAHSIEQARACPEVGRVIVSTDSAEYAKIARSYQAETPFLRPAEISGDDSTDLEVFQHALRWLSEHEGQVPGICVHLRPTHPNRTAADISRGIALLRNHPEWDSVRSVVGAPEPPFKMWFMEPSGELRPVVETAIPEAHSRPRQSLPPAFLQNACVDVIRSRTILELGTIAGRRIGSMLMAQFHDIDTLPQFAAAEAQLRWIDGLPRGKTFVIDIDGVLASLVPGNDYSRAEPLSANIARVNRLHSSGNRIVLVASREPVAGRDWSDLTHRQMREWGVQYDEIRFGKPVADHYIDDQMLSLAELASLDSVP